MTEAKAKIAEILANPAAHFPSPADVAGDARLSPRQKRAALATWEQDARQLAVATEEGMSGGEPARLDEVKVASRTAGQGAARGAFPGKDGLGVTPPGATPCGRRTGLG